MLAAQAVFGEGVLLQVRTSSTADAINLPL